MLEQLSASEHKTPWGHVASSNDCVSPHNPVPVAGRPDRRNLILAANELQKMRKARSLHLPPEMLGEPAWDIMLGLYVEEERRPMPVTALAWMVHIPLTTVLRWISYLEGKMLVRSVSLSTDARVRILELTHKGREAMDDCMAAQLPPPGQ